MNEEATKPMAEWSTAEHSEYTRSGVTPLSDDYVKRRAKALSDAGLPDEPGPRKGIGELNNDEANAASPDDFFTAITKERR